MPPKKGQKRKANGNNAAAKTNGSTELAPPDPNTWPGWVEMESEPAFFNVMLRDMGVRGARIQEVFSMEPDMLAMLPQPIHALIFLFRYQAQDEVDSATGSNQDHIWFANQIPDFACASVALLNIINNIPDLQMGDELRQFKDFTKDMDPMMRGDAIDNFDFVRRIHNSFATENDILNANMHAKAKVDKFKKKQAAAKAQETKRAKQVAQTASKGKSDAADGKPARGSGRTTKTNGKAPVQSSKASTPRSRRSSRSTQMDPDDDYNPAAKGKLTNGTKDEDDSQGLRRSGRARKPAQDKYVDQEEAEKPEEGYHFIAYMPIGNHVWKLDGLDKYPHDLGSFGIGGNGADGGTGDWMHVATPAIMQRMGDLQDGAIEYNLMAVVHDDAFAESKDLVENVKALQAVDTKLTELVEDWREIQGAETPRDVVTGMSAEFAITEADIGAAKLPSKKQEELAALEDLSPLLEFRGKIIQEQAQLRSALRAGIGESKYDDEKARHRRHDYGKFVREWLGELAAQAVLGDLVDG